jgi:hypothetical protein
MRIYLFFLCFLVLMPDNLFAQQPASGYTLVQAAGAYSALTGGTNSTATGDDGSQNGVAIGFTFNFAGVPYNTFSISTNGWIRLGGNIPGLSTHVNSTTNLTSNTFKPVIAAVWDDNHRNTGSISYLSSGTAPNRVLEVNWHNVNIGGGGSTSPTNLAQYKIRLFEGTDLIEFEYGTMAAAGTLSAFVGLSDAASTATFLSVTPGAPSTTSNATQNHAISSLAALASQKLTFTPPPPPSCLAPVSPTNLAITITTANHSWTAPSPAPSNGYEWAVTASATAPASGTATMSTTASSTGLSAGTAYWLHVRSICASSSTWTTVAFNTLLVNDLCANAIDLATLTSPFTGTTAGASDDDAQTCALGNTSPDIYYYIDVPNGQVLTIGQTSNGYDSENYLGYGGACGITNVIACYDDSDTQTNTWLNCTGTTQRVYWVQDGFSDNTNFGSFTLAWSIAPAPIPVCAAGPTAPTGTMAAVSGNVTWAAVPNACSYDVYLDQNTTPTTLIGNTATTSIAYSGLSAGQVYYVSVVPKNTVDGVACTSTFTTTNVPPPCTASTAPTGTAVAIAGNITFGTAAGATDYDVYLDIVTPPVALLGNTTSASISYTGLAYSQQYYVQIRPHNASGYASGCSITTFTTVVAPPANDNCSNAVALTTQPDAAGCPSPVTGTTIGATLSPQTSVNWFSSQDDDVWYKFTASSTSHKVKICNVTFPVGTAVSIGLGLHDAACGNELTGFAGPTVTITGGAGQHEFTGLTVGTEYRLRVLTTGTSSRANFDISITDPPTCFPPTALVASAVTTNSATVAWTAPVTAPSNGYEWVVTTSATPPATGTPETTTSASATGLMGGTIYNLHVRSNCGAGGFGQWVSSQFSTQCNAANLPYTADMSPASVACLSVLNNNGATTWGIQATAPTTPATGFTAPVAQYSYDVDLPGDDYIFTQGLNLTSGNNYRVTYKYANNSTTFVEKMDVRIGTGVSVAAQTTVLADHPNVAGGTLQNGSVGFTVPTSGVYYISFRAYSDADEFFLYLDDIEVKVDESVLTLTNTFIEGYMDGTAGNMKPVMSNSVAAGGTVPGVPAPTAAQCDIITVELHAATTPFATVHTATAILSTTGAATVTFPGAASGNSFYVVVKGRNIVETWSAAPVAFTSTASQSFATAFGSNLGMVGSVPVIYSGDMNGDGEVNGDDYAIFDAANAVGALGYEIPDLNGDGEVNGDDYQIFDPNNAAGVLSAKP